MPSVASKFKKVIERNTFYFQNYEFEQENEAYVHSMLQEILNLKDEIDKNGLNREIFVRLLREKENGLDVLLTITGFSQENLLRLLTFIRVNDDKELARITNKNLWFKDGNKEEWKISQIKF
jgi:hypothetical protein